MPLVKKTFSDFINLAVGKAIAILPGVDPNKVASFLLANSKSSAATGYALQDGIQDVIKQINPQTADDDFLSLIGSYDNTIQLAAVQAMGQAAVGGTLTTKIAQGTQLNYGNIVYETLQDAYISTYSGSFTATYSGGTVTVTTLLPHTLSTGLTVTISGCSQSALNGDYTITALTAYTFSYSITAGSYISDSGSYSAVYALLNLLAIVGGYNGNVLSGTALSINLPNVNTTAYVGVDGLKNGSDQESQQAYLARVMQAHSLTPGIGNIPQFLWSAKKIPGNTRVFVIRAVNTNNGGGTGSQGVPGYIPAPNETCIYIVRDNDLSIQASTTLLATVKNQFLSDGLWGSHLPASQLYVMTPNLSSVNFRITGVSSITMQNAIINQLIQFWIDNATMLSTASTIKLQAINNFLTQVKDPTTGLILQSNYTLVTPSTDVTYQSGYIPVSGSFTWI